MSTVVWLSIVGVALMHLWCKSTCVQSWQVYRYAPASANLSSGIYIILIEGLPFDTN